MSLQILQINFLFEKEVNDFETAATRVAAAFAQQPGLLWKIWLLNAERKEAGGIYLFRDEQAVAAYLQSPLFEKGPANPAYKELSVKQFSVLEAPSMITHGAACLQLLAR